MLYHVKINEISFFGVGGGVGVNHCDSSPTVVFWTCPAWKMSDVRVCDVTVPIPYLNSMWFRVY